MAAIFSVYANARCGKNGGKLTITAVSVQFIQSSRQWASSSREQTLVNTPKQL